MKITTRRKKTKKQHKIKLRMMMMMLMMIARTSVKTVLLTFLAGTEPLSSALRPVADLKPLSQLSSILLGVIMVPIIE